MKRMIKNIIAYSLIAIYMLSMAHTLFHHQMHLMLAHADDIEQVCGCCSSHHQHSNECSSLDHTHENQEEKDCKSTTQFIPASIKPQIPNVHIEIDSIFASSPFITAKIEEYKESNLYRNNPDLLPPEPDIDLQSLRAPPVGC